LSFSLGGYLILLVLFISLGSYANDFNGNKYLQALEKNNIDKLSKKIY